MKAEIVCVTSGKYWRLTKKADKARGNRNNIFLASVVLSTKTATHTLTFRYLYIYTNTYNTIYT